LKILSLTDAAVNSKVIVKGPTTHSTRRCTALRMRTVCVFKNRRDQ